MSPPCLCGESFAGGRHHGDTKFHGGTEKDPNQYLYLHLFAVAEFDALHYAVFLFAMARHGKLQTNLEYWLARIVLALFELLPLSLAIRLGQLFGRLGRGFGKLRRTGQRNLALAFPEADAERRQRLLRGCFENLGRSLGVFSHFRRESPDQWRKFIECEGLDNLQAARADGRGVILFTGHIGSWELTSFSLSVFDRPFKFLVRRIENPKVEALVDRFRTCRGNRTIDKMYAAREMLQTLQSGETLGILVDLNTLDREAVFVDFFEVKAATTFLVAKLALRTGAAVLPVFAPWDAQRKKFRVQVGEPLKFERTGDESENIIRLTQTMTATVEDCVRHYPDQWLWIHRRWKTRPPGEPEIY